MLSKWLFIHFRAVVKTMAEIEARPSSSVGCASAWYSDGCRFNPPKQSFLEIGHEIVSATILSLPLIQEG